MASLTTSYPSSRPAPLTVAGLPAPTLPLGAIVLLALAVHGPLLMLELPQHSVEASTHIFFGQHYAQHWFQPWNEKWFAGFSQTIAPPLVPQLIGLFSHLMSVTLSYMLVQLFAVMLLPVGVFRYARLWVGERPASLAAIASIFLGSLAMLVYAAGQLPTVLATALLLNAAAYLHSWLRETEFPALVPAILFTLAAAATDHIALMFAAPLILAPAFFALREVPREPAPRDSAPNESAEAVTTVADAATRLGIFAAIAIVGVIVVMFPFWVHLFRDSLRQLPLPNGSRDNLLFHFNSAMSYWLVPMGALLLALPFVFSRGLRERRLLPLFIAFYVALIIGLGGTTPVAAAVLGAFYPILTLDRFTFWATLLALPIAGLLLERLLKRYDMRAAVALVLAAVLTFGLAFAWITYHPYNSAPFKTDPVVNFLERDNHNRYRYLTLGFGPNFAEVTMRANAFTIDGGYIGGRLLPELAPFGASRLDMAKSYGSEGMQSLRAVLKHANQYGLKYIFVRDRYYEPLLAFAGWRQVESYDNGNVILWSKEDVPPARPIADAILLPAWERGLWGILPMLVALLALLSVMVLPRRSRASVAAHSPVPEGVAPGGFKPGSLKS